MISERQLFSPHGKVLSGLFSFGVMAATFSMVPWLIGWQQPLLFGCKVSAVYVYAIATHECGHAWAARYLGLPTAGFVIEPFGGWSSVLHSRHWDEVFISAMGPVFSLISAGPLVVLYVVTGDVWWAMAAFYLLFGQAINLLPVWKLDGGRLADALFYRGKSWHWDAQLNAKGLMVGRILYASLIVAYLAAIAVLSRFVIVF